MSKRKLAKRVKALEAAHEQLRQDLGIPKLKKLPKSIRTP